MDGDGAIERLMQRREDRRSGMDKTQEVIQKLLKRREMIMNVANAQIAEIGNTLQMLGYAEPSQQPTMPVATPVPSEEIQG